VSDVLFFVAAFTPFFLNIILWRRLRYMTADDLSWQRQAAYLGVLSNSLAIALPLIVFLQSVMLIGPTPGDSFLDAGVFFKMSAILAIFSILMGALSPRKIRLPLVLSGLMLCSVWVMIPKAIF
jgi:hypothetical protein